MLSVPKFPALLAVCALASAACSAQTPASSSAAPFATQVTISDGTPVAMADAARPASPPSSSPQPVSQVRIVRLSEIRGTAQLDRSTGRGFEPAFANIPITRGSQLRTDAGLAEVEFEDNSTLRLAPDTAVAFAELGRGADGQTITTFKVLKGMVYVNLGSHPGTFTVVAGGTTLHPSPKSHLRFEEGDAAATLAVMDGSVDVQGRFGFTTVPKKRTLMLPAEGQPGQPVQPIQPVQDASGKIPSTPFDDWDKQGNAYQSRYANTAFGGAGMGFGSSDLNYYGSFADLPGCGSVWRPYFTNAAWDPYGAGTWAMYPGAGYSFVSPYPWGWLPFHSGSWQQCGSAGWGWNPNGGWLGLNNVAALSSTNGRLHATLKPPVGHVSLVSVGTGPLESSRLTAPGTFTFRQNSAGLGVPRDVFGKLGRTSQAVERHGSVNTEAAMGVVAAPTAERAGSTRAAGVSTLAPSRTIAVITRPSGGNGFSASATPQMSSLGSSRGSSSGLTGGATHSASASASSSGGGGGGHK